MDPGKIGPVIALLAVVGVFAVAVRQAHSGPLRGWHTDLSKAEVEAKKAGRVVMIDFNATWCGPCQMYRREVFPTSGFQDDTKDVVLVDIDVDEQPSVAEQFGVSSIPDIRFLSSEGNELGRVVGYEGAEGLLQKLADARQKAKAPSSPSAKAGSIR